MRKLLALILALVVVFSLAMPAMAAEGDHGPVSVTKTYWEDMTKTAASGDDKGTKATVVPNETLSFAIAPYTQDGYSNPTQAGGTAFADPYISASASADNNVGNTVSITAQDTTLYIHYPEYKQVGRWFYTVKESNGDTTGTKAQGAGYDTNTYILEILVTHPETDTDVDYDAYYYQAKLSKAGTDGKFDTATKTSGKTDSINNEYKVHDLTITKEVKGDLSDPEQEFSIDVTLKSTLPVRNDITIGEGNDAAKITGGLSTEMPKGDWVADGDGYKATTTVKITPADGDAAAGETSTSNSIVLHNIPENVTYVVKESDDHNAATDKGKDPNGSDPSKGYTVTYTDADDTTTDGAGTIDGTNDAVKVTNEKKSELNTGVILDSAPYVLLLAVAVLGLALVISKKRAARD